MSKFKEIPKQYDAAEVDTEIAILTQSRDFWKKKYEELEKETENLTNRKSADFLISANTLRKHNSRKTQSANISKCPKCYCMTHTSIEGRCGKCGELKAD